VTERHRQQFSPQPVHDDGHESVTVASRFTQRGDALTLSRQLCSDPLTQSRVMKGNAPCLRTTASVLPAASKTGPVCCLRSCPLPRSHASSVGKRATTRCPQTPRTAASCELMVRSWPRPNGRKSQRWLPRTILRA
jgi:hypothetical protein